MLSPCGEDDYSGWPMPSSEWFVLNLRDAKWVGGPLGTFCEVEPEGAPFDQVGVNVSLLQPARR